MNTTDGDQRAGEISALLIDIDGVLYTGGTPVPGAVQAVSALQKRNVSHRYLSNGTRRNRAAIAERLQRMGFPIRKEEILTPAVAAAGYLAGKKKTRAVFVTTDDVREDFADAGIIPVAERVDAVIIGDAGNALTYDLLNTAFRAVMQGAQIVALEKDRYWMDVGGLSLAAGPVVAALEFATRKKALVIGKPSPAFFRHALSELHAPAGKAVMVGDDIQTDIQGAMRCGMAGFLVRTGKFRQEALAQSAVKPTRILDAFPGILDFFPE
jgi:HAD superfamily hydrolase (TIGR01458 family)